MSAHKRSPTAPSGTSFTMHSRYIQAIREGPARYPDHILVTHPQFDHERPSPYMLFYYDITAPNPVLLENDVVRDARLRKSKKTNVTKKYWQEDPPMDYMSTTSSYPSSRSTYYSSAQSSEKVHKGSKHHSSRQPASGSVHRHSAQPGPSRKDHRSSSSAYYYSPSTASDSDSRTSSTYESSKSSHRSTSYRRQTSKSSCTGSDRSNQAARMMHPDLRRPAKRDLKFSKRELYFDAHQLPEDAGYNGTVYSHLPQYSTSYKNYPNVAFDVVNPRNYREFFNERHTPGFFTAHRPTNHKVQGRRAEKNSGY